MLRRLGAPKEALFPLFLFVALAGAAARLAVAAARTRRALLRNPPNGEHEEDSDANKYKYRSRVHGWLGG